mmetsp:Transcript_12391/g.31239  ORF Transcript_12391/g.31239 Transcript_12391/m.31239 type:complete len:86 (-) Transcript_12391:153-410(-)
MPVKPAKMMSLFTDLWIHSISPSTLMPMPSKYRRPHEKVRKKHRSGCLSGSSDASLDSVRFDSIESEIFQWIRIELLASNFLILP